MPNVTDHGYAGGNERERTHVLPNVMDEALQGLANEEIEVRIQDLKKDFEARYATYIGHAMLQFQDRESIVAPYNFK